MTDTTLDNTVPAARTSPFPLKKAAALGALLLALLAAPIAIGDQFISHIFITIFIFAGLSTAWNIVGGYAGQLSLGHAIFYGIGAYAGVMLMNMGISPWLGMFAGAAVSVVVAVAISYPCFRLRGPFFSLATIAFLEVFRVLALHLREFTGGATGLMIPLKFGWEWMVFRDRTPALLIAFGLLVVALAVAWWIRSHRLGFYLVATRERQSAAQAAGVNTVKVRLIAVSASAALTAFIGTFHAMYLTFIEPAAMFSLTMSIQIAMFALIGGLGTVIGPLVGALFLVPLSELARGWLGAQALGLHGFVYGVVLVLVVLFMPNGLMGILSRYLGNATPQRGTQSASVAATPRAAERPPIGNDILIADHLDKHFAGLHVTNDVSFSLKEGEILGLIGPNGAGKTTVFNMLSGFLKPDSGSVKVRTEDGSWQAPLMPGGFRRDRRRPDFPDRPALRGDDGRGKHHGRRLPPLPRRQ